MVRGRRRRDLRATVRFCALSRLVRARSQVLDVSNLVSWSRLKRDFADYRHLANGTCYLELDCRQVPCSMHDTRARPTASTSGTVSRAPARGLSAPTLSIDGIA